MAGDIRIGHDTEAGRRVALHVGARLRELRVLAGVTQASLGEALGVSFQQVQKYEKAANRIAASRLYLASRVLGCSVSDFFVGLSGYEREETAEFRFGRLGGNAGRRVGELVRLWGHIPEDRQRDILRYAHAFAAMGEVDSGGDGQ